ncbi:DNA polymerase III subunit beta [Dehalococcoidia bacterium]|nr:DNA polymerase III subunit beta [Dehalococcoidia bacterium]
MAKIEQLNIEGKRSGEGFVAHKAMLVNALSRAIADRVMLNDVTLGRKGFLGYLKALGGSNIVKVTPANGSASESQTTDKRLKVICGTHTSYLTDGDWIGDKTPMAFCQVRVCPSNSVIPNIGATELAEALNRVIPFSAKDDTRPVLQCVKLIAENGKLTLVSTDGFRLAIVSLDCHDAQGQALISADDLKGIAGALKRAKRARIELTDEGLTIDTELIRYKWANSDGVYPDFEKLIPAEKDFTCSVSFDTVEAIKAVSSLKSLANGKEYAIDLVIGDGKLVMANLDDKGQAELTANTEGQGRIWVNGLYLAQALRACGGMVDFKLSSPTAPMLFTTNGYKLVVMPMAIPEAVAEQADQVTEAVTEAEAVAEAVAEQADQGDQVAEDKPKRRRKDREAVAVA